MMGKKNTEIKNILKILILFSRKICGFTRVPTLSYIGIHMYEENVQEQINRPKTSE